MKQQMQKPVTRTDHAHGSHCFEHGGHCHCEQLSQQTEQASSCCCEGHREGHSGTQLSPDDDDGEPHHHSLALEPPSCGCAHHQGHSHENGPMDKKELIPFLLAVLAFGLAFLPFLPNWGQIALYAASVLLAGYSLIWNGVKELFSLQLEEDALMAIAAIAAFALGEYPEACMVVLLFSLGEFLEQIAIQRSRKNMEQLSKIRPDTAQRIAPDGAVSTVAAESVQVGDTILIRTGDRIPLDCKVLQGNSAIDNSALTGETMPVAVEPGSALLSGGINLSGVLTCEVTKSFAHSTASQIIQMVYASNQQKGKTERFITRFSKVYTPIVIVCGILLAVVPPLLGFLDFKTWIIRSLIFLVASCPCALVISVPLSFFSSIGAISKQGVFVKGTKYIETLSKLDAIALDKTGTLTSGSMKVAAITPTAGFDLPTLARYAASAEQYSTHPISKAIVQYAQDQTLPPAQDCSEIAGLGVEASIEGHKVLCGGRRLLERHGISYHQPAAAYLCIDRAVAGLISFEEIIPPENLRVAEDFRRAGVNQLVMLTGDSDVSAQKVAQLCRMDSYHAGLLPEDKVKHVKALQQEHTVGFVGDGINDAPVLAAADLGISMGLGSEVANDASDVIIMGNRLWNLPKAILIAKRGMKVVRFNVAFALIVKLLVILLVAAGLAPMWLGVFADTGVTILATLNAVRIFSFAKR